MGMSTQTFRADLVTLIQDAVAGKDDAVDRVKDEAKTSMFVFLCMYDLFQWDPFTEITPQQRTAGIIDYFFEPEVNEVACYVEVKKFSESLRVEHVRKYLINRKDSCPLRFGILTNLRHWHIYAYSTKIGPSDPVRVVDLEISSRSDMHRLEDYLTYSRGVHGFKNLRDKYVATPDVIINELLRFDTIDMVSQTIRCTLRDWGRYVPLPRENSTIQNAIRMVVKGEQWKDRERYAITSSECERALLNSESLHQVKRQIEKKFPSNLPYGAVKEAIRNHIDRVRRTER